MEGGVCVEGEGKLGGESERGWAGACVAGCCCCAAGCCCVGQLRWA